ncbi:hypothetical protein SDC9_207275 [bioreactor metagenome]|uniref:Uncharacterized protein n=1 Tax=bioreactor metagenome TaxID=1076179 RepID=A0A645JGS5_9ZZZZ
MVRRDQGVAEPDFAVCRLVDAGHAVERGRLSGAVRPDQGDDLAAANLHRQVVDRDDAAELHRHIVQSKHGLAHFAASFPRFLRNRSGSSRMPIMPWR